MGLVADHDRVGARDAAVVADEPLVGLDRHRAVGVVRAVQEGRREPLLVAAVGDLADELVDEVAAVGEDQDATGAGRLDEADGGDGLARAGRVLEPEAPARARVLGRLGDNLVLFVGGLVLPVLRLLVRLELLVQLGVSVEAVLRLVRLGLGGRPARSLAVAVHLAVRALALLDLGDQRGERARQGVHLVLVQLGTIEQGRRLHREEALQPEHERVLAAPFDRGLLGAGVELGDGRPQPEHAYAVRGEVGELLALEQDRLAGEGLRPLQVGFSGSACRASGNVGGVGHRKAFREVPVWTQRARRRAM